MGTDPQGELEYAKKDVDSLGDGMLILKKHERQRRSSQHHLQEGICPICKRKVVRSLFENLYVSLSLFLSLSLHHHSSTNMTKLMVGKKKSHSCCPPHIRLLHKK